jgi:hypothetical protein
MLQKGGILAYPSTPFPKGRGRILIKSPFLGEDLGGAKGEKWLKICYN